MTAAWLLLLQERRLSAQQLQKLYGGVQNMIDEEVKFWSDEEMK